jgi:hypothetical protein
MIFHVWDYIPKFWKPSRFFLPIKPKVSLEVLWGIKETDREEESYREEFELKEGGTDPGGSTKLETCNVVMWRRLQGAAD